MFFKYVVIPVYARYNLVDFVLLREIFQKNKNKRDSRERGTC